MARTIAAIGVLIFLTGCQSFYRSSTTPPARLNERLAAIEHTRLKSRGLQPARPSTPDRADTARLCIARAAGSHPTDRPLSKAHRGTHLEPLSESPWRPLWDRRLGSEDMGVPPAETQARRLCHKGDSDRFLGDWWALTDLGSEAVSDETQVDLGFSTYDAEREENYARRPPLDSFWETVRRDLKHMPGDLWRDTKRVYANPTNLVILGTAYGGSLALQQTGPDDTVEDHYRHGHHTFSEDWRDAFGAAGNPGTHFALAGLWYLVGQQGGDEKTYEVGKTMFSALIINGLTTMIGQAATWDRAPNGEWGTFPSGHTSSSFCMASVLHEAYGHAVGIPLYGLATLVAMERIDSNEHYFSDVMMGAVVGTVIGHSVASGRDPEFFGWKVLPYANPNGGTGVAFMKTLP